MKRLVLIALLALCGCDELFQPPQPYEPDVVHPADLAHVILVSESWCQACQEQKPILEQMVRDGKISGFEVVNSKHPTYKAKVLPTLYVCCDHGCRKLEGLQSAEDIEQAAQH